MATVVASRAPAANGADFPPVVSTGDGEGGRAPGESLEDLTGAGVAAACADGAPVGIVETAASRTPPRVASASQGSARNLGGATAAPVLAPGATTGDAALGLAMGAEVSERGDPDPVARDAGSPITRGAPAGLESDDATGPTCRTTKSTAPAPGRNTSFGGDNMAAPLADFACVTCSK